MGPRLRTTFLGLLAAAAAVLVINLSTAATHRATAYVGVSDTTPKVTQGWLRTSDQPGGLIDPRYETQLDVHGRPVIEADNFADEAATPLVEAAVVEGGGPTNRAVRFPGRERQLPPWARTLPLFHPTPTCLTGPTPGQSTRLTRRFVVDVPGPELQRLRRALCVVRLNRTAAFTRSLTLFAFRYLPYILLLDQYANIVASHTFNYLTTVESPKWVNSTTVSGILRKYGNAPAGWVDFTRPFLWNVETGHTVTVPFKGRGFLHHDMEFSPLTNTFLAPHRWVDKVKGSPSFNVLFDDIYEIDLAGRVVWSFEGAKHIPYVPGQWSPRGKHPDSDCVDFRIPWCRDHMHGNTVFWDQEEGVVYYNAKHTDSFWKIRKADGKVLWAMGRYGNMTLLDQSGRRLKKLFEKAHGLERIGPDHFLLFDNVYQQHGVPASRWLEITVDPVKKVAQEHRYWVAPPPRFAHQMGDADRLPNGNTVMSITSTDHITEATPEGTIAWELILPAPPHGKGGKWWIYQVERFMLIPLVVLSNGGDFINVRPGASTLELTLWNTVRVRYRAKGIIEAVLHAEVLAAHPFTFAINWMPTPLAIALPPEKLPCGPSVVTVKCTNADDITGELQVRVLQDC